MVDFELQVHHGYKVFAQKTIDGYVVQVKILFVLKRDHQFHSGEIALVDFAHEYCRF